MRATETCLRRVRITFTGLVVILSAFGIIMLMIPVSVSSSVYELSTSNVDDRRSDAYENCVSRLNGKLLEQEATSTCFEHVYGDIEDKKDLSASQEMVPKGGDLKTGDRSEDGSEDGNGERQESEEQSTDEEQDAGDAESDESDEPEDQIMVIEGGKKVAEY